MPPVVIQLVRISGPFPLKRYVSVSAPAFWLGAEGLLLTGEMKGEWGNSQKAPQQAFSAKQSPRPGETLLTPVLFGREMLLQIPSTHSEDLWLQC